jgi:hypothetical protein
MPERELAVGVGGSRALAELLRAQRRRTRSVILMNRSSFVSTKSSIATRYRCLSRQSTLPCVRQSLGAGPGISLTVRMLVNRQRVETSP